MKTQQLKILAQQATPWPWKWFTSNSHNRLSSVASGKDGDVISAFKAVDGAACVSISHDDMAFIEAAHPGAVIELIERLEVAERERDELRKILQATQGGAAEAIKNVMRLQEEISRLDKESQRLSDQLGACDRQRLDWLKRALTAEAEIARRDAAASGPVAIVREVINGIHVTLYQRIEPGTELYAAPPAVLPPEMKPEPEKYDVIDHGFIAGYNQCRADALALGAQQQKTVTLQGGSLKSDGDIWYRAAAVVELLKSAGVEVKP